jgi:hypothetical protein
MSEVYMRCLGSFLPSRLFEGALQLNRVYDFFGGGSTPAISFHEMPHLVEGSRENRV